MVTSAASQRIRIVVGKPGLDGHDRGAKIVARALRDAGHEVIYTGLHQTPEQIVETAIQEDADLIGLSVLSGAHMTLFRRLVELLETSQVARARELGWSWREIADVLGVSRQAVHKKHGHGRQG